MESQEKNIVSLINGFEIGKLEEPISDFIYYDHDIINSKTFIDEEKNEIILGDKSTYVKLSISHALAQSVKLNVLEISVSNLLDKTAPIQQELANTGSVSFKALYKEL